MPDIIANTSDGEIEGPNVASFSDARNGTTGTADNNDSTATSVAVFKFTGRGGGSTFRCDRSFFLFDTSGVTGTVSEAILKIRFVGTRQGDANAIVLKSDAFGGDGSAALANDDFNNLDFSTPYSSEVDTSNISTYTEISLNATALADMKNNDQLILAIINHDYDYSNSEPSTASNSVALTFADQTGTSTDPRITYTLATGYSHDIMGLASANIGKVNTLATANVGKISGT